MSITDEIEALGGVYSEAALELITVHGVDDKDAILGVHYLKIIDEDPEEIGIRVIGDAMKNMMPDLSPAHITRFLAENKGVEGIVDAYKTLRNPIGEMDGLDTEEALEFTPKFAGKSSVIQMHSILREASIQAQYAAKDALDLGDDFAEAAIHLVESFELEPKQAYDAMKRIKMEEVPRYWIPLGLVAETVRLFQEDNASADLAAKFLTDNQGTPSLLRTYKGLRYPSPDEEGIGLREAIEYTPKVAKVKGGLDKYVENVSAGQNPMLALGEALEV